MSSSRRSGDGDEKKGVSRKPVPRPGTMAHLRHVEEQKRKEISEQRRGETLTPEVADSVPPEISGDRTAQATLPQSAVRTEISVKARVVIHGAAVAAAAAGGGLAQIPGSGSLVITPIQISMIIALGSLHGKTLNKSSALGVLAAAYGPYVGRTVSQLLIGWMPGVGNVINATTAFVVTESIGWAAHSILSDG
jgi:uncharacterized protein (DUF697 family)